MTRLPGQVAVTLEGALASMSSRLLLLLVLAAAAVATLLGLSAGITRLVSRWYLDYSHGWLALAMSLWLLGRSLVKAGHVKVEPAISAVLATVVVVLAYDIAVALDVTLAMTALVPIAVVAAVAAIAGFDVARRFLGPIALVFLAAPVWDATIPVLQKVAVALVDLALRLYGPPAHIVGSLIEIPAGSFEIQDSCSGLSYLQATLTLTVFYGLAWYSSWRSRVLLVAVGVVVTLLANALRIYGLVLVGDATDMQHELIVGRHVAYGWWVYLACMAPVLWMATRIESRQPAGAADATAAEFAIRSRALVALSAVLVCAVLISPRLQLGSVAELPVASGPPELLPPGSHDWQATQIRGAWRPDYLSPYWSIHQAYLLPSGSPVEVFIARYVSHREDAKLLSKRNALHAGWQVTGASTIQVGTAGSLHEVQERELLRGSERRLIWYWYLIGDQRAKSFVEAKAMEVVVYLAGRRDGAVMAVSAECDAGCESARASMHEFVSQVGARIEAVAGGSEDAPQAK